MTTPSTGAPSAHPSAMSTDRRTFLAAAPALAVLTAAPSLASPPDDPVSRYWQAASDYNADRISEEEYSEALDALDYWEPPTMRDFLRKFEAAYEDGAHPNIERSAVIMEQAKRLLARSA